LCFYAAPELFAAQSQPSTQPLPVDTAPSATGAIGGVVQDSTGAIIPNAEIQLLSAPFAAGRAMRSDAEGRFRFVALPPASYQVAVRAQGFAAWTSAAILVHGGDTYEMPPIVLQVAAATSAVDVTPSQHDIAQEQLKTEEKQRLNGLFPNFKVTYNPNAAPLTAGQKLQLAWATAVDPATFLVTGAVAGYEQDRNNIRAYGQGAFGYARRFGANYGDAFSSELIGTAILPSILHQDPRYFYKGTGSTLSRALYAIAATFVCKGDDGSWQPNYSGVTSSFASGAVSNTYYPPHSRGFRLTVNNALLDLGLKSFGNLLQEFLDRNITPSAPKNVLSGAHLVLPEGTPVSLMLVEDLDTRVAGNAVPVAFSLAEDVRVDGVIVAKRGDRAFGEAVRTKSAKDDGADGLEIHINYLQATDDQVRLRASREPDAARRPVTVDTPSRILAGTLFTVYVDWDTSIRAAR
jgi:hypothetical protein